MDGGQIWPAHAGDEEYSFLDDVSGYRERFEGNSGVFGDGVDIETCVVNSLGEFTECSSLNCFGLLIQLFTQSAEQIDCVILRSLKSICEILSPVIIYFLMQS